MAVRTDMVPIIQLSRFHLDSPYILGASRINYGGGGDDLPSVMVRNGSERPHMSIAGRSTASTTSTSIPAWSMRSVAPFAAAASSAAACTNEHKGKNTTGIHIDFYCAHKMHGYEVTCAASAFLRAICLRRRSAASDTSGGRFISLQTCA